MWHIYIHVYLLFRALVHCISIANCPPAFGPMSIVTVMYIDMFILHIPIFYIFVNNTSWEFDVRDICTTRLPIWCFASLQLNMPTAANVSLDGQSESEGQGAVSPGVSKLPVGSPWKTAWFFSKGNTWNMANHNPYGRGVSLDLMAGHGARLRNQSSHYSLNSILHKPGARSPSDQHASSQQCISGVFAHCQG